MGFLHRLDFKDAANEWAYAWPLPRFVFWRRSVYDRVQKFRDYLPAVIRIRGIAQSVDVAAEEFDTVIATSKGISRGIARARQIKDLLLAPLRRNTWRRQLRLEEVPRMVARRLDRPQEGQRGY
jgi:hypothetical protein